MAVSNRFQRSRKETLKIDETYNKQYLRAEYNFATQSTLLALKWKEYEKDGDDYNLQYRTANDERVRKQHAALHNITLPPSDPFWNSYYLPNELNCRCNVVQVRKSKYPVSDSSAALEKGEKATTQIGKSGVNKAAIFRFNPGKEMKLMPPKHPYLPKGCGNCVFRKERNLFTPVDKHLQMCQACGELFKQCLANNKSEINAWKEKTIDKKKGLTIDGNNFKSGSILVTRGSIRESLRHIMNMAVRNSILSINENAIKWEYCGWAECKMNKETGVRKHPEADYFLYYKTTIGGVDYYANVKANKNRMREELYCIRDRISSDINKGNPPNIERYKSK